MARSVVIDGKIFPSDSVRQYGSLAIKLPMDNEDRASNADVFNMSYSTEEQAISNMINLLLTRDGERFMRPRFGVGLYYYVFEQNSLNNNILLENRIREQITTWLPYIDLVDVTINNFDDASYNGNAINIMITFKVFESSANRTISIYSLDDVQLNVNVE